MYRLISCIIGLLGLGVIITEIIKARNLFDFKLKLYFVAGPMLFIFSLSELKSKNFESETNSSIDEKNKYRSIVTIYYFS